MIAGQLTGPGLNFASMQGLTPATVPMSFLCPRETSIGGLPGVVQHRVTHLAQETFLHLNKTQSCPMARVVLRTLIINVQNKFPNKKFQRGPEIGKRV